MTARTRARSTWCRANDHVGCSTVQAVGCECACHGPAAPVARGPKRGSVDRAKASATAKRAWQRRAQPVVVRPTITKEDAPCCVARRDKLGRLPIGFCSKQCVRRPRVQR